MEVGIVVFHGVEGLHARYGEAELLEKLAPAGVLGGLAAFDLAARELPEPCHLAVSALHGEQLLARIAAPDDAGGYMYGLHVR